MKGQKWENGGHRHLGSEKCQSQATPIVNLHCYTSDYKQTHVALKCLMTESKMAIASISKPAIRMQFSQNPLIQGEWRNGCAPLCVSYILLSSPKFVFCFFAGWKCRMNGKRQQQVMLSYQEDELCQERHRNTELTYSEPDFHHSTENNVYKTLLAIFAQRIVQIIHCIWRFQQVASFIMFEGFHYFSGP